MTQWHWNPETYLANMRSEVPAYDELQERAAGATDGVDAATILELGIGTGETARRVLARHPRAHLTAIDSSPEMLARARSLLSRVELRVGRLEEPLPPGPFDLVVSALAIHHLDGAGKRDLFGRVYDVVGAGGRFVLADVVVPERPEDVITPIDWQLDLPDSVTDQLAWLGDAGFDAQAAWVEKDLAVLRADKPIAPAETASETAGV